MAYEDSHQLRIYVSVLRVETCSTYECILRQEKLDLARSMKIKIVLFNPLYLVTYVPCALKALLRREVAWVKIEHGAEQP